MLLEVSTVKFLLRDPFVHELPVIPKPFTVYYFGQFTPIWVEILLHAYKKHYNVHAERKRTWFG